MINQGIVDGEDANSGTKKIISDVFDPRGVDYNKLDSIIKQYESDLKDVGKELEISRSKEKKKLDAELEIRKGKLNN
jgi:hypothetical protein